MRGGWLLLSLAACSAAPPVAPPAPKPRPAPLATKPVPAAAPAPVPPSAYGLAPPLTIAAGELFSCAIRAGGTVGCWGDNVAGQLGDGTDQRRAGVVAVQGVDGAVEIAARGQIACARTDKGVLCWGDVPGRVAKLVGSLGPTRHIAIAEEQGCAIEQGGTVRCWDRETLDASAVPGIDNATGLALRYGRACARTDRGQVWCWTHGEAAKRVPKLERAVEIATGNYDSCARLDDGSISCWSGDEVQPLAHTVPRATRLAFGDSFGCAADELGALHCWNGPTASNLEGYYSTYRVLNVFDRVLGVEVVAGANHLCARIASGEVFCWGRNEEGEIGVPGAVAPSPVAVPEIDDAVALGVGPGSTCAVRKRGTAHCWPTSGADSFAAATEVADLPPATAIAVGAAHDCAIVRGKRVACWGETYDGALGAGPPPKRKTRSVFASSLLDNFVTAVGGVSGAQAVAVLRSSSCALAGGAVRCWGRTGLVASARSDGFSSPCGYFGGDETLCKELKQPRAVPGLAGVTALVAAESHYCALAGGAVKCWNEGVLEAGAGPQPVTLSGTATRLAAWAQRTCAVAGGEVQCWTELGPDASTFAPSPGNVVSLAVGGSHACVALDTGAVQCTGDGARGQLGDGKRESQSGTWTTVPALADVVEVAAGATHTCARTRAGALFCWGAPPEHVTSSALTFSAEPQQVMGL
jgi:alpha-tubulin suppressor-like RCC1 family protein